MIAEASSRNGDGEALVCGNVRLSWRQAVAQAARIASGFRKLGLQRGDRVAILLGNRIEFPLLLFAAAHEGLVTVLLSTRQQKPEIAYVLTDCGAKILIHEAGLAERRKVEAVAEIGRARLVALIALVILIGLLALPSRGRRILPGRWQRYRIERRNNRRLVQSWRRIRIEYAGADHPAHDGDSDTSDDVPDCFVVAATVAIVAATRRRRQII